MANTARDLIKCRISNTPGTSGNFTLSTAFTNSLLPAAADDGLQFKLNITENGVGTEIRRNCTYTHSTTTFSRGTMVRSTGAGDAALNFTANAIVSVVPSAEDFLTTEQVAAVAPVNYAIGIGAGATANTTAIQTALTTGSAKLMNPGIVEINSTLLAPDNSELYIGPGVTLRLASGSNTSMLKNSRFSDASEATITLSLATSINVTATWTGHGQTVGSSRWLSIIGAAQHEYNGVWYCTFTDANSFTYLLETDPSAAATGTITVRYANVGIKVWGPGTIDYNQANNVSATGHENHAFKFLNCAVVRYDVRYNLNVKKFVVLFSNCSEYSTGDLEFQTASDGVHINGPSRGVASVGNLSGYCGDDMLALTCGDYSGYELSRGEIGYVKSGTIRGDNSSVSLVKMAGGAGPKIRIVDIGGLMGTSAGNSVQIIEDTTGGATLTTTYVEHLIIRQCGVRSWPNGLVTTVAGSVSTTVARLTLMGLKTPEILYGDRCIVRMLTGSTIGRLDLIDGQCEFGATSTGDVVRVDSGATLTTARFRGFLYTSASSDNVLAANSGTLGSVFIEAVEHVGNTGGYLVSNSATNTVNVFINGLKSTSDNSVILPLVGSSVINLYSKNWVHSGSGPVYNVSGSTLNWFGDCDCATTPAPAGTFRANGTMYVDGSTVSAPATGDTFNNTNAGFGTGVGFYGRTAAGAWTKVF